MKDERIAVLHVLSDRGFGGALSWLEGLLTEADHRRFRYGVILPTGSEAERKLARNLAHLPVTLLPLEMEERSFAPADLLALGRAIAAFAPDIIQTHGSFSARVSGFFAAPHAYLLLTKHCVFESRRSRSPLLARLSVLALRPFTHAAVATAECAKQLLVREGIPAESVLTVRNGAREKERVSERTLQKWRKTYALPKDSLTVGFCSRLEKEKNPLFLLPLAKLLAKRKVPFLFLVIGEGTQRKALEAQAQTEGLAAYFRFTGYLSDPAPALALSDVLLNCSTLSETCALSLLEGFSLGIPAVASDLAGNREAVCHFENGLIYPRGDAHACAALLARLAADGALLKKLASGARTSYEKHFRASLMASKCECFYRSLLCHSSEKH